MAFILTNEAKVSDSVVLAAALLHDAIEDTKTTYEELVQEFGKEVADIVQECTDDKSLPSEKRKELQVLHAPSTSHKVTKFTAIYSTHYGSCRRSW